MSNSDYVREQKHKRDAEARWRAASQIRGYVFNTDSCTWSNPTDDLAGHSTDADAHHAQLHAVTHYSTGTDPFDFLLFGAARSSELHVHAVNEDKSNECDNVKTVFFTANEFEPESLQLWQNGLILRPSVDFSESTMYDAFTLTSAASSDWTLLLSYLAALEGA